MPERPWVAPVVLEGRRVRLEPLVPAHFDGLCEVALDAPLWTWMPTRPESRDDIRAWMDAALAAADTGTELPFTTIDIASGRAIGSTRYLNIVPAHKRLEIGWTWVGTAFQRTGANREAKLLQMEHAFEALAANRVEFKTDSLNERSRAALLGIGATYEGTLRDHMIMPDGRLRHSAYYSVLRSEWPGVRAALAERLDRG